MTLFENYRGNSLVDFNTKLNNIKQNFKKSFGNEIILLNTLHSPEISYRFCGDYYRVERNWYDVFYNNKIVAQIETKLDKSGCFFDIDIEYVYNS
ncbi:MAG: hypothetical protein QM535_08815 [Limnohabitans sp.]|nr:hypothetical protein [Limnohabitans sp.]